MMSLRPAKWSDARLLWDWRNDWLTRSMFRNSQFVEWRDHERWLRARLDLPEPHLFIAQVDGEPVGTFRVDGHEVSYTVAPEHRGKGHAKRMLALAFDRYGPLTAEIKNDNAASIAAAKSAGHKIVLI